MKPNAVFTGIKMQLKHELEPRYAGFQGVVAGLKMKDLIGVSQTAVLRKRSFSLLEDDVFEKEFPTIPKNFSPKRVKKPEMKIPPKFNIFYK